MADLKIQTARDNSLVPVWDGFQLHSMYNPFKEGQTQAENFLSTIKDRSGAVIVLGLGFGYHILPILDKFQTIIVVENNTELISLAKKQDFLQPVFEKVIIIQDDVEARTLKSKYHFNEYGVLVLRSELRFQESFFDRIKQILLSESHDFVTENTQIRVLVNSPVYGGSYTTAQYIEKAFADLSVNVRFTDNANADSLLQKYLTNSEKYAGLIDKLVEMLSDSLWLDVLDFKPHIVIFPAQSPFTNALVKSLRKADIVTVYWFVEDFRRFPYWQQVCNNFDYFFMIQKGEFEQVLQRRCNSIWGWFPMAAERNTHKSISVSQQDFDFYHADVSFMGAAYPNRVNFFSRLSNDLQIKDKFKIWGSGWDNQLLPYVNLPLNDCRISIEQSNIIYQTSKINVNLHSSMNNEMFDTFGDFVNPRTFEIAACGGFQLVDDRESVRELFEPDQEIVLFSSIEEAEDKIKFYLKNEHLREKIAKAGQDKVLKFHTYDLRLQNMLKVISENSPVFNRSIYNENKKIKEFLSLCTDGELEKFLNKIEPGLRFSYERVFNELHKSKGTLKNYEAFLLLLDTFCTGE